MMLVGLPSMANVGNVSAFVPLNDGDPVDTWTDSSGNGYDATGSGATRPTFKTSIVNSKPVVRFTSSGLSILTIPALSIVSDTYTLFTVVKAVSTSTNAIALSPASDAGPIGNFINASDRIYASSKINVYYSGSVPTAAFHVITSRVQTAGIWVDGTGVGAGGVGTAYTADFARIGARLNDSSYSDSDFAEIIYYSTDLSDTQRANIEKGLADKYGLTVAGGTAAQPDTMPGLVAWWKADSLG